MWHKDFLRSNSWNVSDPQEHATCGPFNGAYENAIKWTPFAHYSRVIFSWRAEVKFLPNETGQKSPKTRKEEKARRKRVNATKSLDVRDMFRPQEVRQRVEEKQPETILID